ncbi:pyridoxine biosynthesis protein [Tilletia horrida]|uniref:Pyridoxine biosynthesis protein n=1 Tax=Tilletia horrida TaxID=155126 RepID=A0AAN6GCA4_9BASI|nr:pyridoxine biosynthesis protein [Tilletia horrida]
MAAPSTTLAAAAARHSRSLTRRSAWPPHQQRASLHASAVVSAHEAAAAAAAMFPSVARILAEHSDIDASKITGTGIRGMITKGDVLAHLGEIGSPLGSAKGKDKFLAGGGGVASLGDGSRMKANTMSADSASSKPAAPEKPQPLPAAALRSLITSGLAAAHPSAALHDTASASPSARSPSFESIVSGYAFASAPKAPSSPRSALASASSSARPHRSSAESYFHGLF